MNVQTSTGAIASGKAGEVRPPLAEARHSAGCTVEFDVERLETRTHRESSKGPYHPKLTPLPRA